MILVDLATSSADDLREIVRVRCSHFGSVTNMIVHKDGLHGFALAGVEMSTAEGMRQVRQNLGDHTAGSMVVIRLEQALKPHRILIAGVPETFSRLSTILTGYAPHFIETFEGAQKHVRSTPYDLIMIGVHFDESRMFDLLYYLKARASEVPVICYRLTAGAETRTKLTMLAVAIASRALGAVAFLDLFDAPDEEAANGALRELVDRTLAAHPPATAARPQSTH